MLTLKELYDQRSLLALEAVFAKSRQSLGKITLCNAVAILALIGLSVIGYLEYHLINALFSELVEDTETTFTAGVMALTAVVMILGFHTMAAQSPDNPAVRFIRACPKFFIPVYLIGVSLIIGGLIYDRGVLSLLSEGGELNTETLLEVLPQNWTETFIVVISNPIAALAFSLGIGGLAVVNIFTADYLLNVLKSQLQTRHEILQIAQSIQADYALIKSSINSYQKIDFELADLNRLSDDVLAERQGMAALDAVADEIIKPKRFVINAEHAEEPLPFLQGGKQPLDLKSLKAAIAKIEAIDLPAILHWMTAPKLNSTTTRK